MTTGTFSLYLIPGTYDILIDKVAHLDEIYVQRELNEGDEIDLGIINLIAGDLNKDGQIQLLDLALLSDVYDAISGDENFVKEYDINEDDQLQLMDMAYISANYDMIRNINM